MLSRPDAMSLAATTAGDRFDSPAGDYAVSYFGSTLEACFGETMARFRPSPVLLAEDR